MLLLVRTSYRINDIWKFPGAFGIRTCPVLDRPPVQGYTFLLALCVRQKAKSIIVNIIYAQESKSLRRSWRVGGQIGEREEAEDLHSATRHHQEELRVYATQPSAPAKVY